MKSFNETVKEYSLYKEAKCGDRKVTVAELHALRDEYREDHKIVARAHSFNEATSGNNFMKVVHQYAQFKEQKTGSNHVTSNEIRMLKEGLKKNASINFQHKTMNESSSPFATLLKEYSKFKEAKCGDSTVTLNERIALRASLKPATIITVEPKTFKEAIDQYAAYKKQRSGNVNAKITRDEFDAVKNAFYEKKTPNVNDKVITNLKEAVDCIRLGRRALKEGDMPLAQDMAGQAGAAVDAANAVAPAGAPVAIDPTLAQKITDVKTAVDDLATAAGVSAPVNLGADAGAGIPPVAGQPAAGAATPAVGADQTGAAPAQMPESTKIDVDAVRERIAARKAYLDESDKNPYEVKDITAGQETGIDKMKFDGAGVETNPTQLSTPTIKQIEKGTDKDVVRWGADATFTPPKGVKPVGGVKESTEESLTDKDVQKYLEKLDFKKIFSQSNGVISGPTD